MGQLESYTIQDIFLVAILSGVLSTYFAEEIEATIESVAAYIYSANQVISRKRVGLKLNTVSTGVPGDASNSTYNFLGIEKSKFFQIDKPVDDRTIWQDLFLSAWGVTASLESSHIEDGIADTIHA